MPYVPKDQRVYIVDSHLWATDGSTAPGELNYRISVLVNEYFKNYGFRYQTINDVMGALEGAKLEMYRRVAAPYEDVKREQNGDVYESQFVHPVPLK
jgi:hypothetical protein